MGKNKQMCCKICHKDMRSDNLNRHMKVHMKYSPTTHTSEHLCQDLVMEIVDSIVLESTQKANSAQKEMKRKLEVVDEVMMKNKVGKIEESTGENGLEKYLLEKTEEHKSAIKLGKEVYRILAKGEVLEAALPRDMKEALELYMMQGNNFIGENAELKPWQSALMKVIKNPTDRHIIWVVGKACGEGKSWFQKYLKSLFGTRRVVYGINIKANTPSICHVLSKQSLATADIFLFNIGKSKRSNDQVNYEVLEDLKDGDAFASKYNSQQLKIKVPNIVMVFSNTAPDFEELAEDRWRIFYIENEQLEEKEVVKNGPMYYSTIPKKKIKLSNTDDDDENAY